MSDIRIRRAHSKSIDEAKRAMEKLAKQLQRDFDLRYAWDGEMLRFHRLGVDGELHVGAKEIRLEARLGALLAFMKPQIQSEIEASLDRLLDRTEKRTTRR